MQGRDSERAAAASLLLRATSSRGGSLVLRGLPGVGKSTLLASVADDADGFQVLRTRGVESESPLAFAALHRLLRPVSGLVDRLPAPQVQALRAVFGEAAGGNVDRYLVFLATLSLLAEAADEAPVLAVVDDAQWLDDASAAALLFAARRLEAERVALLFAAREGDVRSFDSGDLASVELGALDADAAAALVGERAGVQIPEDVATRLVAGTGGNALALAELSDVLPAAQLQGQQPLPVHLPLTEGVERAFLERYRRLPEPARTLLLVAAADDSGRVSTVLKAASELGAGEDALDDAERSGLVHVRDAELELRHPLVRSAIYGAATSRQRRLAHGALAQALTGGDDADRRAWHLAAATSQPDEAIVAELAAAAERAASRGGHEAASAAWERAAELSADDEKRAGRLLQAAEAAWVSGQPARARVLADVALRDARDPALRADIALLRARVEWNTGSVAVGHRMVLQAAKDVAPTDPDRALEMAVFGASLGAFGTPSDVDIDPVSLTPPLDGPLTPRERVSTLLVHGFGALARGDLETATSRLREAFAVPVSLDGTEQDLLPNLGVAAMLIGDDEAVLRYHDDLLARARQSGAVVMVLYALTRRGLVDVLAGRWSTAETGSAEALRLARNTGQEALTVMPLLHLLVLAALRGSDDFDALLAELEGATAGTALGTPMLIVRDGIRWAKGILEAVQPATAFHHLEQIDAPFLRLAALVDRVEAAVRAGQRDTATEWVAEAEAYAEATGLAWAGASAAHGRALLSEGDEATGHFERSLSLHEKSLRVVDRARTQLAYGEHLRRARRRVAAREHLRAALQTFEDLGARPLAERARTEPRASGETARRREAGGVVEGLTPQELQVAALVAKGLPNREVAAQLFLSPRTIDFHLRNVFAKLGVTSRSELAAMSFGD
ncbi:MAG: LuxR C-terminal-related transcriptional regulator [Actinomycetes bacterium]